MGRGEGKQRQPASPRRTRGATALDHLLFLAQDEVEERLAAEDAEIEPFLFLTDGQEVFRLDYPAPATADEELQLIMVDLPLAIFEERATAAVFALTVRKEVTTAASRASQEVVILVSLDRSERPRAVIRPLDAPAACYEALPDEAAAFLAENGFVGKSMRAALELVAASEASG